MYEIYCKLRDQAHVKDADVVKATKITKSTFSDWKNGRSNPKLDKLQKIADYFGVTVDYLMTGKEEPKEKSPELTARDEKDITKTLNKVMEQFENNENGPLYYDGEEIDETSRILIRNAFEYIIRETKKENKVKYNPNKNKTKKQVDDLETIDHKICRLVRYYVRMVGSRDPAAIAKFAGIGIATMPLSNVAGYYTLVQRKRWICINEDIPSDSPLFKVVVAHELGHALLHRKENCAFIKKHTLLLTSGIEREANQFAAELLIPDDMLQEYSGCTSDQFCACTGYPKELIDIRLHK